MEKNSSALFYNDIEDEDEEDIEEDFDDENDDVEMNLSQEEAEGKASRAPKLQIKFPNFMPKKLNEHIVTMSDDESDDFEENKLEIDEAYIEQDEDAQKSITRENVQEDVVNEESNESNLEPGEVPKAHKEQTTGEPNLLLELSRAASMVEVGVTNKANQNAEIKSEEIAEELSPSKAKRVKLNNESITSSTATTPPRSTRSTSGQTPVKMSLELFDRTVTRSATKRTSK